MGAFGEYIAVKGDLQIKIPDNLSFEEASTLGIGITTVVSLHTYICTLSLANQTVNRAKVCTRSFNSPHPTLLSPPPYPS